MEPIDLKISNSKLHFKQGVVTDSKYTPQEKVKLAKASKDFESVLTSMMLKSMTKTNGGLFGKDNYGGDVLDVLFETEISNFLTESQGMGVAEQIYTNLTGEKFPDNISQIKKKIIDHTNLLNYSSKAKNYKSNVSAMDRIKEFDKIINDASQKFNVDKNLIKSVILTESAGKTNARSKADAKGLMQLMDSTATEMGVMNPWDPKENIYGGTKYLSKMLDDFDGDTDLALAAYNAGPGNVRKYGGMPPFKETMNYVNRVNNYLINMD